MKNTCCLARVELTLSSDPKQDKDCWSNKILNYHLDKNNCMWHNKHLNDFNNILNLGYWV